MRWTDFSYNAINLRTRLGAGLRALHGDRVLLGICHFAKPISAISFIYICMIFIYICMYDCPTDGALCRLVGNVIISS